MKQSAAVDIKPQYSLAVIGLAIKRIHHSLFIVSNVGW